MEESSKNDSVPSKQEIKEVMGAKQESKSNAHKEATSAASEHKKHESHKAKSKTMKHDNAKPWKIATAVLAVLLVIVLFARWDISISAAGSQGVAAPSAAAEAAADAPTFDNDPSEYYDENDPVLGDADAPVTIVEWSDFECPFCARALPVVNQIKDTYVAEGKVKIVYRDFPLSFHPEARPAALAAECAHEQGKFWEFHDLVFENQAALSDSQYKSWASGLGLNTAQFNSCLDSEKYSAEVAQDFSDGGRLGVQGTPSFFVNGVQISGAQPFSVFEAAIEAALEAAN